jgi:hypothetical protein
MLHLSIKMVLNTTSTIIVQSQLFQSLQNYLKVLFMTNNIIYYYFEVLFMTNFITI